MIRTAHPLRSRAIRASSLSLLCVVVLGCSDGSGPFGPDPTPGPLGPDPTPAPPSPPIGEPSPPAPQVAPRGTLEVTITGADALLYRGYRLTIHHGDRAKWTTDFNGGTIRIPNLLLGDYSVLLETPDRECAVAGDNPRAVLVLEEETSVVEFTVSCPPIDFGPVPGVYARASYANRTDPGTPSERIVLDADGAFRLEYDQGVHGIVAFPGTYASYLSASGAVAFLEFAAEPGRWFATAALSGDCLVVEYSPDMSFSDFEDGAYCRS